MEEIQDLRRKVNHLEYDEIKKLDEKITNVKDEVAEVKKDLSLNSLLTQQSIDTQKDLKDTMDAVKMAMYEITASVKESNANSVRLTEKVEKLGTRFNDMEQKVDNGFKESDKKIQELDNKSKIDFVSCFKDGGWKTVIGWVVLFGVVVYEVLGRVCVF